MLEEILTTLKNVLKLDNIKGLDERNTDRVFITPVLTALGWNLSNLEETFTGYSPQSQAGTDISYALFSEQKPVLLVEIRPLYSDIYNDKLVKKFINIAGKTSADVIVITNGVDWSIYGLQEKNFCLAAVTDINQSGATEILSLLTKENILKGTINEHMQQNPEVKIPFAESQAKSRGYKVTDKTHKTLVQLKNKIMTNRRVKDQDISHSNMVETLLEVFFETVDYFDYTEISNAVILKNHMEEAFKKRFSK